MKNNIKVERAKNDMTQAQLAKHIGVSRQTINATEKGKYIPSTLLALRMARLFNCSVEELFEIESKDDL